MKPDVWLGASAKKGIVSGGVTRKVNGCKAATLSLLLTGTVTGFLSTNIAAEAKLTPTPSALEFSMPSVLASRSLLLDVDRLPGSDRLVSVGERGHILYSDDHGINWSQAAVPTRQLLTAAAFPTAEVGYAVGHDAVILKTEDGGRNWGNVYIDVELEKPLLDVWFRDANYGIAVGAYGLILRTKDGGQTWEDLYDAVANEDEFHYNAITPLGDDLMMVGEAGTLYRSQDDGNSWETLSGEYDGSYFGLIPLKEKGQALAHGLRGNLYKTEDAGDSWKQVTLDTDQTLFGAVSLGDDVLLVGNSGTVVNGSLPDQPTANYNSRTRPDRLTLSKVVLAADGSLVAVGQGGVHIIKSDVTETGK